MPSSKKPTTKNPEPMAARDANPQIARRTCASAMKPTAEPKHLEKASSRAEFDFIGPEEESDTGTYNGRTDVATYRAAHKVPAAVSAGSTLEIPAAVSAGSKNGKSPKRQAVETTERDGPDGAKKQKVAPASAASATPSALAPAALDAIILALAERGKADPGLTALMQSVSGGHATAEEYHRFQSHVEQVRRAAAEGSYHPAAAPPLRHGDWISMKRPALSYSALLLKQAGSPLAVKDFCRGKQQ
jgi:hypothetical protein